MFTGIIEEIGTVLAVGPGEITVGAEAVMSDLVLGQSIAIDGVDLTVAALTERRDLPAINARDAKARAEGQPGEGGASHNPPQRPHRAGRGGGDRPG